MKKFAAILCILIFLLSLVACDSTTLSDPVDILPENEQQTPALDTPEENKDAPTQQIAFSEVTVVDNEYCTIKITDIDPDNLWGYTLKAHMENKTADTTLMFSVTSGSINGVMVDPLFASEIAAGKKSNEDISFTDDILTRNGIVDFTDIELNFRVYDSNDWTAEEVAVENVHIYPYGEENATSFVRQSSPSDVILVDNEYATVIVTDYENDAIWGYTANLFILNKTDTTIMVSVDEASVNGYMVDPFFADSVDSGKCAFSGISWANSALEENGISEVETIEFVLRIYDSNDWLANDFANEQITLTP